MEGWGTRSMKPLTTPLGSQLPLGVVRGFMFSCWKAVKPPSHSTGNLYSAQELVPGPEGLP